MDNYRHTSLYLLCFILLRRCCVFWNFFFFFFYRLKARPTTSKKITTCFSAVAWKLRETEGRHRAICRKMT